MLHEAEDLGGWVKVYRRLIPGGWFSNHDLLIFWLYCLLKASHRTHKALVGHQQVMLQPGQFIFGRDKAAQETRLSPRKIRTCVNALEKMGNLTIKTTNKYSVITLTNWALYQGADEEATSKTTSKRPAGDQQATTYKKGKNVKKGNNGGAIEEHALSPEEEKLLEALKSIPGYPFDSGKDIPLLRVKLQAFPEIDVHSLIEAWRAYLLDHPLRKGSSPRAQLANQFLLAKKWGKHPKTAPTTTGNSTPDTSALERIRALEEQFRVEAVGGPHA